ncbi:hypothetical protein F4779DRAFT_628893 [Xylariaceae sp. FL0662B]|nr:hypothetical protein F4779DRAFT_628893 [Xylariaceae sp. FL0662B]
MSSSLEHSTPNRNGLPSFMEKLSSAIYFYRPPTATTLFPTIDPQLVLILGWMDARDIHLSRYINQYKMMYPSSAVLLGLRDTAPTVGPILATLKDFESSEAHRDSMRPGLLIHSLSGGGPCSLYHLYNHFAQRREAQQNEQGHITIFDSSPGAWSYQFNRRAMMLPAAHLVATIFWVLIRIFGLPDNQKTYAAAHNDPRKDDELSRTYIYGSADKICPPRAVESDVAEATKKGFDVRLERFDGSGHVAHIRVDPDRYWRIVKEAWDIASRS